MGATLPPAVYAASWELGRARGPTGRNSLPFGFPRHYSGWVYAAVRAIAQGCAAADVDFTYRRDEVKTVAPQHPLAVLFERVNPFHTYRELIELTLTDLELSGNAFWVIAYTAVGHVPAELWPVPPRMMRIVPGRDHYVHSYQIHREGRKYNLAAHDVIHFKYPAPDDAYWGASPLAAAMEAVFADEAVALAQRRSFQNAPVPGVILNSEMELSQVQIDRMKTQYANVNAGVDNAGKMLVAPKGIDLKPFTTTPKEMDFVESSRATRDRILGVFGVPPAVLGLVTDMSTDSAGAAQEAFIRATLTPKLKLLAQRITQDICRHFLPVGLRCAFRTNIRTDREQDRKDTETGVKLGFLAPNEARARLFHLPSAGPAFDTPARQPFGPVRPAVDVKPCEDKQPTERE